MNIMQMMKQAQNLQQRIKEVQKELEGTDFVGEAAGGAVSVTYNGQGRFKSIKLKPEAINPENPSSVDTESLEMLEDLISTAISNAIDKASKEADSKIKAVTGGINIPGLNL